MQSKQSHRCRLSLDVLADLFVEVYKAFVMILIVCSERAQSGFETTTLHDTFGNMAWIWMLTNNCQVEWVDMDPYGSISTLWKQIHAVVICLYNPGKSLS